ncbi:MAG: hypothetical protein IKF22_03605 [Lachnospiraceae bacterium]|nr:hypothetical protein [Oscillospiraceae bacterium]MBR3170323.1 hypothetical protein [Lachnospiraceae bacterium]
MGLFGFGKKKKESSANDDYRSRSLRDMKVPPSLSDAMRANVKHDDRIIVGSEVYKLVSVDDHVRSHLYVGSYPVGQKVSFVDGGKYISYKGRRIASVEDKLDSIRECFASGGYALAITGSSYGTDLILSVAFYKKISKKSVEKIDVPVVATINSEKSYFMHSEFEGMIIDEMREEYYSRADDYRYVLYHDSHEICALSPDRSGRIRDLLHSGYRLSEGKVEDTTGTKNNKVFTAKITLSFLK